MLNEETKLSKEDPKIKQLQAVTYNNLAIYYKK